MSSTTNAGFHEPNQNSVQRWGRELSAALKLGWPLILTNVSQAALTATDVIFIGRLGKDTLASALLATSFYHTLVIFSMGLVSAVMPMIAIALGKNRHSVRDVRRTVRQGFWTAIIISIPIWVVLWHCEEIFLFLGQQPDIAARSTDFMHTLQWALLPYLFYIVLRSFFAAMEKPMWTLLIAGAAIGFNALAGWTLIFGHFGFPRMELHGAGIATTLSSLMMFLGMAVIALRHRRFRRYHLFGRFWRPDWPRLRELWRIGFPMALTFVFETSIFYAAVVMMGRISPTAMAAHAVAIQIASLSFMVPLGFGQVATVRVGRAYGAGNPKAVAYAGWSAYALGVGFMMIMGLLMILIPRLFIGVFLDLHDPENLPVMELAVSFLALAALFQTVDGAQAVAAGMLRGMRDTRVPMFLALLGYWGVGLPLGALLAFKVGMGGQGIWLGLAAGLGIVAVMMTLRWRRHLAHISRTLA
ncbi:MULTISPECIES: MATE family efflux transporter [Brucella/Ochrobactrum group]|uniref:Multidrug-efflux transporter n=2 Tax=Ochrobactrum TaxID=528 RepID=A0ABD5JWH7_9HYPH|nr:MULTISPECIES: MATE family efflux transporter [Brucella]MCI1000769.1 MATE family efflux transporter [Ochrobactrum sp. C6C9]RRD28041.1 MATE family efflux transporter [Brucellaceae bacterium VT-16-1752]WHT41105.1 MATE family efflux transporter [Ochrobactrum sp. SSR]MDX4073825.1 MATE family efflux transporter [Brucella sp. NBRC 113783]RLL75347.1 MATE family efflux transporter [[Ochrobactrum] soli]